MQERVSNEGRRKDIYPVFCDAIQAPDAEDARPDGVGVAVPAVRSSGTQFLGMSILRLTLPPGVSG